MIFIVSVKSPSGEEVFLPVEAADDQSAMINAGKAVNRKVTVLHPDATVEIAREDGRLVCPASTVAEMTKKR